jgi:hypothetical protein
VLLVLWSQILIEPLALQEVPSAGIAPRGRSGPLHTANVARAPKRGGCTLAREAAQPRRICCFRREALLSGRSPAPFPCEPLLLPLPAPPRDLSFMQYEGRPKPPLENRMRPSDADGQAAHAGPACVREV